MTIKQMIKEARMVFVWVCTHPEDGMYIQVTKSHLLQAIKDNPGYLHIDKFDLREWHKHTTEQKIALADLYRVGGCDLYID